MSPERLPTPVVGHPGGVPVPVTIEPESGPVPVVIEATPETPATVRATAQAQTAQESETVLHSQGQRDTSMLWETTQTRLANLTIIGFLVGHLLVVIAIASVLVAQWSKVADSPALAVMIAVLTGALGSIATLAASVISSYFHRTNSTRVGGPGGDSAGAR